MDRGRLPVAPLYADVQAYCSHVNIYCKEGTSVVLFSMTPLFLRHLVIISQHPQHQEVSLRDGQKNCLILKLNRHKRNGKDTTSFPECSRFPKWRWQDSCRRHIEKREDPGDEVGKETARISEIVSGVALVSYWAIFITCQSCPKQQSQISHKCFAKVNSTQFPSRLSQ